MNEFGVRKPLLGGKATRRQFLQTSAATAAAAAGLSSGMLPRAARAAPQRGGTMRYAKGHGNTTDTLDPATYTNGFTTALSYGVHGFLTGVGADGSLEPSLAESWEATPDAKTWRFKIRKGVSFHSGKPLTLDDIVASVNHHRGKDTKSVAAPFFSDITDIKTEGDDTVVFELSNGNADFPFVFSDYHVVIGPAKDGKLDWQSGDGCGPYKLVKFDPGVSASFERNKNDWTDQRGFFDAVEMLSIVDLNARTTALVTGDVQAIDKLDLKTVGLLGRKPGISIATTVGNQHYTFVMRTDEDPFKDNNVRLALKYAINREELVQKILYGYGTVGNDQPIGRGQRFFNKDLEQRVYDPDKAKFHLKQAGMSSLKVQLSAADAAFPGAVDAGVLYQDSAKKAGIDIEVKRVPNDGYWSDVWLKAPFCAVYWSGRSTEDAMFSTAYKAGAPWNDAYWVNDRFNKLLVEARAELDTDKRRAMYYEMQKLINEDGGTVIPMFANWTFALNEKVGHGDFASNWDSDGERWMERWWFNA